MANNKIQFDLEFNLDQTNIKLAKDAINELKNTLKKDFQNGDLGVDEFKKATAAAKELDTVLDQATNHKMGGQINMDKLDSGIRKSFGSAKQLKETFDAMGPAGQKALNSVAASAATAGQEIKQTSKLVDSMAKSMKNTLKWGISSAIFNSLTRSVQQAWSYTKSLDASLNDIRIVTGDSADQMERFAQTANRTAKDLGASTLSYTNAALIYYQQGLSEAEANEKAAITLKAANITGQSSEAISEQLTAVWNGYKVSAEEAELYVDKLQAVAATTASDLAELSTGMSKVASAANLMGVDMDSLNAQLATIISVTKQAPESVGTALKTIYARMGDIEAGLDTEVTLGEYTSKMAEMGVNVLDANGKLREMDDVIEEIGGNWSNLSREQQIALSQVMAGTRQYNNLLALFDNWDMYTEALNTSANAAGALNEANEVYMESIDAHLQQLSTEAQRTYDILFDTDTVNGFIDAFSGILDKFNNFIEGIGGGTNALIYFGAMFAKIFKKQIANEIIVAQNNLKNFFKLFTKAGRKEVNSLTKGALMQQNATAGEGVTNSNSKGADAQLAAANQIYKVKQGLTQEEIKQAEANARQIGILTNQLDIQEKQLQNEKEQLEIQQKEAKSSFAAFDEDGGLKSRGQIASEVEVAQTQMNEVNAFMQENQELDKILTKLKAQEQAQQKLVDLSWKNSQNLSKSQKLQVDRERAAQNSIINANKLTEEEEEQLAAVTELVVENRNLLNLTEQQEQALMEAIQALKDGKFTAEQYSTVLKNANNLQSQGELYIREGNNALQIRTDLQEANNNEIREELNLRKQANDEIAKKGGQNQNTQNAVSYLMDASMMISSMTGAWETFNDEAATGEQKAHAVGSAIGGVASSAGSIIGTIFGGPAGGMIGGALGSIAGSIGSVIFGLDSVEDRFKSTQERLDEIHEQNQQNIEDMTKVRGDIESLEDIEEEYNELSKKAGEYDKNISNLTEEEQRRYAELKDKILEYNQEALIGYDEEGNAILKKNAGIQETIDLLKKEREEKIKNNFEATKEEMIKVKKKEREDADKHLANREENLDIEKGHQNREIKDTAGGITSYAASMDWEGAIKHYYKEKYGIEDADVTQTLNELDKAAESGFYDENTLKFMEEVLSVKDEEGENFFNQDDIDSMTGWITAHREALSFNQENIDEANQEVKEAEEAVAEAYKLDEQFVSELVRFSDTGAENIEKLEEYGMNSFEALERIIGSLDYEEVKKLAEEKGVTLEEAAAELANSYTADFIDILNSIGNPEYIMTKLDLSPSDFSTVHEYNDALLKNLQEIVNRNKQAFLEMGAANRRNFFAAFGVSSYSFDDEGNLGSITTDAQENTVSAARNLVDGMDYFEEDDWNSKLTTQIELTAYFNEAELRADGEKISQTLTKYLEETEGNITEAVKLTAEEYEKIYGINNEAIKQAEEELGIGKEMFLVTKEKVKQRLKEQGIVDLTNDELNDMVLEELRINKTLKEIASNWENIKKKINSTNMGEVYEGIADAVKLISALTKIDSEELSFLYDEEAIKELAPLMEDMIRGVEGSYTRMLSTIRLKQQDFVKFNNELLTIDGTTAEEQFSNFANGIEDIINSTDTTFLIDGDNSSLLASLNEALRYTDANTTDVQKMLKRYGFSAKVTYRTEYVDFEDLGGRDGVLNRSLGKYIVKIPTIEVLTKDDGGFGGGYTSTGSGGGGGNSGPTDKMKDSYDPYHEVNTSLSKLNEQLEKQEKIIERLNGNNKVSGLRKQLKIMEKQVEVQKEKVELLQTESEALRNSLGIKNSNSLKNPFTELLPNLNFDLSFDKEGHIKNYAKVFGDIETEINSLIEQRNNTADTAKKEALDKQIEEAQKLYETLKEEITRYEEILFSELPGVQNEIYNILDQQAEAAALKIQGKMEEFTLNAELGFDYEFAIEGAKLQAEALADQLERADKAMEKMTGKDKIKKINSEIALLEEQYETYLSSMIFLEGKKKDLEKGLNEVFNKQTSLKKDYLNKGKNTYREALDLMYADIVELENNLKTSKTEEERQAAYLALATAQAEYEELKKWIEELEKVMYEDIPEVEKEIQDNFDKKIELQIEAQALELQVKLDFKNARKELNEFQKGLLDEKDLQNLAKYNQAIFTELAGTTSGPDKYGSHSALRLQMEQYNKIKESYDNILAGEVDAVYGVDAAKALEDLTATKDEILSLYSEANDVVQEMHDQYLQGLDQIDEEFTKHLEKHTLVNDKLQYQVDLLNLVKGISNDETDILNKQLAAYKNMKTANTSAINSLKEEIKTWEKMLTNENGESILEEGSEEYEKISENLKAAEEELRNMTTATLENVNQIYETSKKIKVLNVDNILFSPAGTTTVDFQKEKEKWEKLDKWQKKYLDSVKEGFEYDKLAKKIQDAIDETDSLAIQKRLNDLKEQELDLLEKKGKITQKEVDRMNALLDVELKRIALEEAQRNKNTMRLRRDASGNYSYQYVTDQKEVDKAQDELDKSLEKLYETDKGLYQESAKAIEDAASEFMKGLEEATTKEEIAELIERFGIIFTNIGEDFTFNSDNLTKTLKALGKTDEEIEAIKKEIYSGSDYMASFIDNIGNIFSEGNMSEFLKNGMDATSTEFQDLFKPFIDLISQRDSDYENVLGVDSNTSDVLSTISDSIDNLGSEARDLSSAVSTLATQTDENGKTIIEILKSNYTTADATLKTLAEGTGAVSSIVDILTNFTGIKRNEANASSNTGEYPEDVGTYDTGGYTGDWHSTEGKIAILHQKELVLNEEDTKNLLQALQELKSIQAARASELMSSIQEQDSLDALINKFKEELLNMDSAHEFKIATSSFDNLSISLNVQDFANKLEDVVQSNANLLTATLSEIEKAFKDIIMENKTEQNFKQNVQINAEFPGVNNSEEIERAFNSLTSTAQRYVIDNTIN